MKSILISEDLFQRFPIDRSVYEKHQSVAIVSSLVFDISLPQRRTFIKIFPHKISEKDLLLLKKFTPTHRIIAFFISSKTSDIYDCCGIHCIALHSIDCIHAIMNAIMVTRQPPLPTFDTEQFLRSIDTSNPQWTHIDVPTICSWMHEKSKKLSELEDIPYDELDIQDNGLFT